MTQQTIERQVDPHVATEARALLDRLTAIELGDRKALFELGNLLRRLDESTLRALVQWQGAADEDEMTEAGKDDAGGGVP